MSVNPRASGVAAAEPDFFSLMVARKQEVAQGIYWFELRHRQREKIGLRNRDAIGPGVNAHFCLHKFS